ncbi:MAG TPA: hypothetical protein VJ718_01395 [Candidatus Binataceae bacterium]|nr:hypothetical protein [Candidatus Binataceae bacterium]
MVGKKTAVWFLACGCIAAIFGALGGILLAASIGEFNTLNLLQAVILFGLGIGTFFASRVCATLAFGIYLYERASMYYTALAFQSGRGGSGVIEGFWISAVIFSGLYLLGIIGAFSWHADTSSRVSNGAVAAKDKPEKAAPKEMLPKAREFCGSCNGLGKIPGTEVPCAWCDGAGFI